jgi:peptidoglycan/xylan/chitin deacetylase (PgdA/CDA1 family)
LRDWKVGWPSLMRRLVGMSRSARLSLGVALAVLLGTWLALPHLSPAPASPTSASPPPASPTAASPPPASPTAASPPPASPKPSPGPQRSRGHPPAPAVSRAATPGPAAPAVTATAAFTMAQVPGTAAPPGGKVIALTFDDGPDPVYTPRVLAVLQQFQVPATFFMIGWEASDHPDLVRQVAADGEGIGNHTWNHLNLTALTPAAWTVQVDETTALLDALTGRRILCVRPPGGHVNPDVEAHLASEGQSAVLWDDDPRDWTRPGTAAIVRRAIAEARPGGIIEMHDGGGDRSETVQALPAIIAALRAQGYSFAPLCR